MLTACMYACSCANSLAYPQDISIDDVQYVLYGHRLGLSLPARDPWSYCTPEDIKGEDIPWLDTVFTTGQGVSVMERLSAFAGHAGGVPTGMPHFAAPPMHAQQLRANDRAPSEDYDLGVPCCEDDADEQLSSGSLRGGAGVSLSSSSSVDCAVWVWYVVTYGRWLDCSVEQVLFVMCRCFPACLRTLLRCAHI